MSEYIVSARKYRPVSFESLIGQDNIARTLKNSILRGQLAHAYLFCGPRGVGKTSAARIFAKTINCSNPGADMEPCGECESCRSFQEGRSYCIHELDAASNNGVDDIKALMDQVQIPPQVGRYSVYIIDEVHMLSQAAFNAFLKTLEEPPAHAIFILATTEKHKIIPTILSRCQTYDFNRISVPDIVRNLRGIADKENIRIDDESLHVIAHKADGAMRDALTIFDQTVAFCGTDIQYQDVIRNLNVLDNEYSFRLVDAFLSKDYGTALLTFDEILSKGFNAIHFISSLGSHMRDLLVSRTGGLESLLDLPDSLRARFSEQAARCSTKFIFDALQIISQCEAGYRGAVNQRLHIEFTLMKLSFLGGLPAEQAVAPTPEVAPKPAAAPSPVAPAPKPAAPQAPVQAAPAAKAPEPAPSPAPVAPKPAAAEPAPKPAEPAPAPAAPKPAEPAPEPVAPEPAPAAPKPAAEQIAIDLDDIEIDTVIPTPAAKPAAAPTPAAPAPAAKPRSRRSGLNGASLSLGALLSEDDDMVMPPPESTWSAPAALPSDEETLAKWKELAAMQERQPRLMSALLNAKVELNEENGIKNVVYYVDNKAQRDWLAERKDLELTIQKLLGSTKVRLVPTVTPEEQRERKIYMPAEQALDLMEKNPEVKEFVAEFGLDIK